MIKACFDPFNYMYILTNETGEAVNTQANHFSDSLQATCNQPKRVNCYIIQYKFIQDVHCSKLRVIWIRSDKFNKSKPCDHETLVPAAAFSLVASQESFGLGLVNLIKLKPCLLKAL